MLRENTGLEERMPLDDPDFYWDSPQAIFAHCRREVPVFWHDRLQSWILFKYNDIKFVARHTDLFTVTKGSVLGDNLSGKYQAQVEMRRLLEAEDLMSTDPPRHTKLRQLVSAAFTPRRVASLETFIRELSRETLETIEPGSVVEAVETVAAPVPSNVIAELIGVPREDRGDFRRWGDNAFAQMDARPKTEEELLNQQVQNFEFWDYLRNTIESRRQEPRDDLMTALAHAEVDGESLNDPSVLMACMILLAGGSPTTRHLISGTILALARHPDQRELLVRRPEQIPTAVEEFLRWWSPATYTSRTAKAPVEINGTQIAEGDFVTMLYASGNRDEDIWERADQFDVTRDPDPANVAFGYGAHFCIGAHLARLETKIVFEELLRRFPKWEVCSEPIRARMTLLFGIDSMDVRFEES